MKIKYHIYHHIGLMTWNDAIDLALSNNGYIPNIDECKELRLHGCWSSTTYRDDCSKVYILGESEPVIKTERRIVIILSEQHIEHITYTLR